MKKIIISLLGILMGISASTISAEFKADLKFEEQNNKTKNVYCLIYANSYDGPIRALNINKTTARIRGAWTSSGYECWDGTTKLKDDFWGSGGDIKLKVTKDGKIVDEINPTR